MNDFLDVWQYGMPEWMKETPILGQPIKPPKPLLLELMDGLSKLGSSEFQQSATVGPEDQGKTNLQVGVEKYAGAPYRALGRGANFIKQLGDDISLLGDEVQIQGNGMPPPPPGTYGQPNRGIPFSMDAVGQSQGSAPQQLSLPQLQGTDFSSVFETLKGTAPKYSPPTILDPSSLKAPEQTDISAYQKRIDSLQEPSAPKDFNSSRMTALLGALAGGSAGARTLGEALAGSGAKAAEGKLQIDQQERNENKVYENNLRKFQETQAEMQLALSEKETAVRNAKIEWENATVEQKFSNAQTLQNAQKEFDTEQANFQVKMAEMQLKVVESNNTIANKNIQNQFKLELEKAKGKGMKANGIKPSDSVALAKQFPALSNDIEAQAGMTLGKQMGNISLIESGAAASLVPQLPKLLKPEEMAELETEIKATLENKMIIGEDEKQAVTNEMYLQKAKELMASPVPYSSFGQFPLVQEYLQMAFPGQ